MTGLDWPAGWDRTSPAERTRARKFQASLADTTADLEREMDRMDVDDWRASTGSGGSYTKSNGLPKYDANPDDPGFVLRWVDDGEQFAVACDAYARLASNVRAVYLWVHETRMRGQRPVRTGDSEFAAARLPSGDEGAIAGREPPHEVLGVAPDAPAAVIEGAARQLKAEAHPDNGGDREQFQRVVTAEEAMLDE
ncbi:J domain-containing protein [Halapricum hydrolyticum]|uniref:J domain-containing protein n=1 Tax=Halapricum hydrolyticum TaxID=2979991 RepID=A0AAE3LHU6_9EURY|nr:J domain-containing protein [Halapricum hydrolyticum]MCU4716797.1 J domain-containing protein [Halapricum hydrolyticum]MCU4725598.1 J domain-containing protein [Halapricum hydrolyticum]